MYKWLFGGEVDYTIEIDDNNKLRFGYVIKALKNQFANRPVDQHAAILPIKIVQNIFTEHEELLEHLLPNLSADFIDYFYTYGHQVESPFQPDVFKVGLKLIDSISTHFNVLMDNFEKEIITMHNRKMIEIIQMMEFISETLLQRDNIDLLTRSKYLRSLTSKVL